MARLPILTTQRITIQPFTEKFISDRYIGWLNDPQVTRYSQQRWKKHDCESCRHFMSSFENSPGHFSALTLTQADNLHIGNISTSIDTYNQVADIAIMIGDRSLWGQGYGLEAWKAVQDYLLENQMRIVTGGCMATNEAMRSIMQKAGMIPYYTKKDFFLDNGQTVDSIHFMIGQLP